MVRLRARILALAHAVGARLGVFVVAPKRDQRVPELVGERHNFVGIDALLCLAELIDGSLEAFARIAPLPEAVAAGLHRLVGNAGLKVRVHRPSGHLKILVANFCTAAVSVHPKARPFHCIRVLIGRIDQPVHDGHPVLLTFGCEAPSRCRR